MKYWVFVDDKINGPFKINEIVNSKYFSKDLLLCPSEMDGIKPSNWYFAKELPEFEPYLEHKGVAVEVSNFDVDIDEIFEGIKDNAPMGGKYSYKENLNDYRDFDIEESLIETDKEIEEYRAKIQFLESKISKLQLELEKTLNKIKEYEDKLKERDTEIEKLVKRIEELKSNETIIEDYKEKLNEKDKRIEELKKEIEEVKKNILPKKGELIRDQEKQVEVEAKSEAKLGTPNLSVEFKTPIEEPNVEKTIELASPNNTSSLSVSQENITPEVFDPFSKTHKKLTPVSFDEDFIKQETKEEEDNKVQEANLKTVSFEKINFEDIFQTADIKLEVVRPNLEVVEDRNLVSGEDLKKGKEEARIEFDFSTANLSKETPIKEEKTTEKKVEVQRTEPNINPADTLNLKVEESELKPQVIEEVKIKTLPERTKSVQELSKVKDESNKLEKKEEKDFKTGISTYRRKFSSVFKVGGFIVFVLFFAASIIYILNSGSREDNIKLKDKTVKYPKIEETQINKLATSTTTVLSDKTQDKDEMSISRISENVKKSIEIVKNFELGGGRGSISKWFSNSFSGRSVKEEWNATYLSGSLFVVQYRAIRYKQEPIVYLFEVDVDRGVVVRGINNNAIDLLSSGSNENRKSPDKKKVAKSVKDKKVVEEAKNNSEIF